MAYIIESDDAVRDSLQALILAQGWPCHAFADSEAFLAEYKATAGDFVIVGEGLEGAGYQAALRALADLCSDLAVVVITTRDDEKTRARLLEAGADAVLVSPFSESDLIEAIRSALAACSEAVTARPACQP